MGLTDWTSQINPTAQTALIVWTGWTGQMGLTDWTSQIGPIAQTALIVWTGWTGGMDLTDWSSQLLAGGLVEWVYQTGLVK